MKNRYFAILALLAFALLFTSQLASAEETQPGVGRVSVVNGEVSTQRGDSGDRVATTVNTPIVPGDQVSTAARSRTEIQLDYANVLRLDENTVAKIADLKGNRIQVQVAQGRVNFDVFKGSEAEAEIDTPSVAVRPLGPGRYRIEVDSNSQTRITVREGEAEVSTPQGSTQVKKGELITIEGTDNPQYQVASAPRKDDWDNWNKDRDHVVENAESWQHTNRYYAGTGDLDRYGHWEYVPGYDYVWAPYAGPGWVPYSAGNWMWEPDWGWTWVSYEPWGWAPYHYGRWFCWGNSWAWWPGPVYPAYRPLWAPAYVSFFGFGFGGGSWGFGFGLGFGAGFGFGASIGWLPIGPHDPFCPWYGRHGNTYNLVNVTNITNITNIRNIGTVPPLATARQPLMSNLNSVNNTRVRQALTTVPAVQFGRGSIAASRQAVTPEMLKQGQLVAGRLPVVPTRESLSAVKRPVNPAALPAHSDANQHFFTKTTPPAGPRPFTQEAAQVRQMIQQTGTATAAEGRTAGTGSPATTAQAQRSGSSAQGAMAAPEARIGSTAAGTGGAGNRSSSFGNQTAAPGTRSQGSSRTPLYDNEALNRLSQTGFGRSGSQTAAANGASQAGSKPSSQRPQGSPSAQSGTVPGSGATAQSKPGWHQFADRSQPGSSAVRDRNQAPSIAERAQPHTSTPTQNVRPGWQSFSQGGQVMRPASPEQGAPSRSAVQGQGGWQRFERPAPSYRSSQRFERPAPSNRSSQSFGSRSESVNPGWNRSPSRFESPAAAGQLQRMYGQSPGTYQRPQLDIRKPIVTTRAPGGSGGGYRGGVPSGAHGSSSYGHSGGPGRR